MWIDNGTKSLNTLLTKMIKIQFLVSTQDKTGDEN